MRPEPMQRLIDATFAALGDTAPGSARPAIAAMAALLKTPGRAAGNIAGSAPACAWLDAALAAAEKGPASAAALARAVAAVAPGLPWSRRARSAADGGPDAEAAFAAGHANAQIVGPQGLEIRDDITVGVTIMAPGVRYPDHRHPPEEVYVVMSEGEWRRANDPWFRPGPGGIVHNPPDIVHAMRSGKAPLFALWILKMPEAPDAKA